MAAASCRCSSVVFVGNIPYHAGEEELRAACEEIGPLVSLRVATDGGTTRPRGFAFVVYLDDETALSACRNMNGRALHGRELRVGLSRQQRDVPQGAGATRDADPDGDEGRPVGAEDAAHAASLLAPGARPSGAVTAYLAGLSRRQVRELLGVLGREDPGVVERAAREYAGLATLIEQARVLLDMASARDAAAKGRRKRGAGAGASPEPAGQQPEKLRRLDGAKPVPGGAVRR